MFRSLKRKVLAFIVLLMVICVIAFTSVSYYEIQKSVTSQMKSDGSTLVLDIKREIIQNNIADLNALHQIFQTIKGESDGNILYVSFSDEQSNIIVSDNQEPAGSGDSSSVDAVSSATGNSSAGGSKPKGSNAEGQLVEIKTGEKAYNVATDFMLGDQKGSLNIGISLTGMYENITSSLYQTILISLVILIIASAIGVVFANIIIKPVIMMSRNIKTFSEGDFTVDFHHKGNDEIGKMAVALNHMKDTLSSMVGNIKENAMVVSSNSSDLTQIIEETSITAREISKSSEEMAIGSSDLAGNAQDGLNQLNNLAEEIMTLSRRTASMKASIDQTKEANQVGTEYIRELQSAVRENAMVTNSIKDQVDMLTQKANTISEITTVIKGIAEQTNLLALNARIESARAGEQGKGFAVVAEEIRKLSVQTANSIEGIETIVEDVHHAILETQQFMQQGSQAIDKTTEVSAETGRAFEKIEASMGNIIQEIQIFVEGITNLNNNKNKVIGSIENISAITQQSTASTEEISSSLEQQLANLEEVAASSKELQRIALELESLMDQFKLKAF